MKKNDSVLYKRLATLINSMGYEFIGHEMLSQSGRTLFRIYIDSRDSEPAKGVTVEDCSRVSHQVSGMMDVQDIIHGRYALEVSSPGIDRPLFELEQYTKYVGKRLTIRLHSPINGRRQYKGVLLRIKDEDVFILADDLDEEVKLPFASIEKANLIGESIFRK